MRVDLWALPDRKYRRLNCRAMNGDPRGCEASRLGTSFNCITQPDGGCGMQKRRSRSSDSEIKGVLVGRPAPSVLSSLKVNVVPGFQTARHTPRQTLTPAERATECKGTMKGRTCVPLAPFLRLPAQSRTYPVCGRVFEGLHCCLGGYRNNGGLLGGGAQLRSSTAHLTIGLCAALCTQVDACTWWTFQRNVSQRSVGTCTLCASCTESPGTLPEDGYCSSCITRPLAGSLLPVLHPSEARFSPAEAMDAPDAVCCLGTNTGY